MDSAESYKKGGGNSCAVNSCTNNRRKLQMWKKSMCELHNELHNDCPCLIPYKFHLMPSDELTKLEWIKAINRKTLPKHVYVCSEHFLDGAPSKRNPFPKLKLGYDSKVTPGRRKLARRETAVKKLKLSYENDSGDDNVSDSTGFEALDISVNNDNETYPEATCSFNVAYPETVTKSTQYDETDFLIHDDHPYAEKWSDMQTTSTQTKLLLTEEKGVQSKIEGGTMSANTNIVTDSDALLYTGVTKEVFFTLVELLRADNQFNFQLDIADQLLLVLMRLKLHLIFDDLGRRFGISKSLACKLFNSWMPVLAEQLKGLVVWLPRETIRACIPESFRENYPRTTVIIDCAETFIQRPTNLKSRSETYSNYKSHNTAKYLVGIAPHGHIMFISRAFGGRASDKFIVEKSGFCQYLLPGDEVMADRGFTIDALLFPLRVKLNIPAFTKCKPQLSNEDLTTTRRIARVRIHVERAIRRLKVFKILSSTVPVSSLKNFDDILLVCSALVNLRSDLIREPDEFAEI
ncbi:Hypothetical predicted protein [Mytilus galloprovincialis]|uniref:THAP-type domain-containing protein n=1 Tax=Mytilus galloprovincialis TaxID=29158 RepID=A0A8B6BHX9_MYTGA|nr:Hypothetical predicted protein [Mytilus galloprovincialis]